MSSKGSLLAKEDSWKKGRTASDRNCWYQCLSERAKEKKLNALKQHNKITRRGKKKRSEKMTGAHQQVNRREVTNDWLRKNEGLRSQCQNKI